MPLHSRDTLPDALLAALPESHVLVLPGPAGPDGDALVAAWKAARDEALSAYEAWREGSGTEDFTVYRAAADREEAAAAVLASRANRRRTPWYRQRKL
jgi:gamma-glutamylcysteine synthetase